MNFSMHDSIYKIIEVDQEQLMKYKEENVGYYYGQTHFIDQEIWIDKDLPYERKKRTLYHELMHVYIREYEEMLCDICANAHEIIDNIANKYFMYIDYNKNEKKEIEENEDN